METTKQNDLKTYIYVGENPKAHWAPYAVRAVRARPASVYEVIEPDANINGYVEKEDFEKNFLENGHMFFGQALELLKRGFKVARSGWNGKNQYIELAKNISYVGSDDEVVNADHDAIGSQAIAFVGTSGVQLGWLASQADMLANDWRVVMND